jgi:hypothetical protein
MVAHHETASIVSSRLLNGIPLSERPPDRHRPETDPTGQPTVLEAQAVSAGCCVDGYRGVGPVNFFAFLAVSSDDVPLAWSRLPANTRKVDQKLSSPVSIRPRARCRHHDRQPRD